MIAFANNKNLKISNKICKGYEEHWIIEEPMFIESTEYRIEDQYTHIREWIKEGKEIGV